MLQSARLPLVTAAIVAVVSLTNCLPDLDRLTEGNGATAGAGAAAATAGTAGSSGGVAAQGGKSSSGSGAGGGSGSGAAIGGSSEGGDAGDGGDPGSGGSATSGGNAGGSAGSGGKQGPDSVCPSYTGAIGDLLSPPSTDFEQPGSWATLTGRACSRTVATASTGNACSGNAFLTCDGSGRQAPWDGATMTPTTFVNGHTYAVTVALRYSPPSAPTTSRPLALTCIRTCVGGDPQYADVGSQMASTYGWVRISGQITASLPDCPQLSDFRFYVNTLLEQQTYDSVDMDDFRIYDLTGAAGGAGGADG